MIIFTNDHGVEGKRMFYEAAARIPMMARAPAGPEPSCAPTWSNCVTSRPPCSAMGHATCLITWTRNRCPALGLDQATPREFIVGAMSHGWMVIDRYWKL